MKTITETTNDKDCEAAAKILKNGGLVIFPTETVYGLAACIYCDTSIKRIYDIKGRSEEKPLSILVANASQAKLMTAGTGDIYDIIDLAAENFWPGPLTLVLPKSGMVPDAVTAGKKTVGIRIPDNGFALKLIGLVGKPLATTSANISGQPALTSFTDVLETFDTQVEMIIKGACSVGTASTVAEYTKNGLKILRQGTVSPELLSDKLKIRICQ